MNDPLDPILAYLRGEMPAGERSAFEGRMRADPALAEEVRSVGALFRALRSFDEEPSAADAARMAARVRAASQSEDAAERRRPVASRRLIWARILAASVGAHAVLLAVLLLTAPGRAPEGRTRGEVRVFLPPQSDPLAREEGRIEDSPWPIPSVADDLALLPALDLPVPSGLSEATSPEDLEPLRDHVREHPPGVGLAVLPRSDEATKRRLLTRSGADADRTLAFVARAKEALRLQQRTDGSFAAADGRTAVGETALALLPFLGDGESSVRGDSSHGPTVPLGVAWLRSTLFAVGSPEPAAVPAADLGIALKTLSEDYVLSYGGLTPSDARRRSDEIGVLAGRLAAVQRDDGSFAAGDDLVPSLWAMWGLDAAARSGAVVPPARIAERFRAWLAGRETSTPVGGSPLLAAMGVLFERDLGVEFRDAASTHASRVVETGIPADVGALYPVAAGTGLWLRDPGSFGAWQPKAVASVESLLQANGLARGADPVGDTALAILTLQVAYRTY